MGFRKRLTRLLHLEFLEFFDVHAERCITAFSFCRAFVNIRDMVPCFLVGGDKDPSSGEKQM